MKKWKGKTRWMAVLLSLCMVVAGNPMIVFADTSDVNYTVDFGNGSWTVGEVTVSSDKNGIQTLSETDTIALTNFDADTMAVKISASDGFNTTLAVTNNTTSLSTKNCDGLPNATLTFSVVDQLSNEGGGSGSGNIQNPKTIIVNVTSGSEYLDTQGNEYIRVDGTGVVNGSVTVEQANEHIISLFPQFGYVIGVKINGKEVEGTENDYHWWCYSVEEADSYDIEISQTGSIYTVVWDYVGDYGDDGLVSNGTVEIISATLPDGSSGIGSENSQNEEGGHVVIEPGSTVTVQIKPDYGYQFLEGSLNGNPITAGAEVSQFTFTMPSTNLHLSALFTEAEDIINTNSTQVASGSIANGGNVVDTGNLKLEIGDLSQEEIAAIDDEMKQTAGDDEVQLYLNMDLYSVVNKGTQNAAWENQLTDLNGDLSVTLELSDALKGTDGTFYVIREHEEADGSKTYTKIPAIYNKETGTITFATNKFSTYALVLETGNGQENDIPDGPDTWKNLTGTDGFVCRLYNVALGRDAEEAGFRDWEQKLNNKQSTAAEVAQGFIFSEEFKNKGYNDTQFVKLLYRTMFGREADEDGLNGWVSDLENGMSREYVFHGFAESQEFTNLCESYHVNRGTVALSAYRDRNKGATGFIARLYTKMLGRKYEEEGLEYWCREYLTGKQNIEQIAANGFLYSQELANQKLSDEEFVTRMYQTFLNREPDEAGFKDWVGRLERGEETRDSLVYGFTRSQEFGNLKAAYNLP